MVLRNEPGKAGSFQPLLKEELMNRFPAFLFRAGPKEYADFIAHVFQVGNIVQRMGHVFQRTFLEDVVPAFCRLFHGQVRQVFPLFYGKAGAVLAVFLEQLPETGWNPRKLSLMDWMILPPYSSIIMEDMRVFPEPGCPAMMKAMGCF